MWNYCNITRFPKYVFGYEGLYMTGSYFYGGRDVYESRKEA